MLEMNLEYKDLTADVFNIKGLSRVAAKACGLNIQIPTYISLLIYSQLQSGQCDNRRVF